MGMGAISTSYSNFGDSAACVDIWHDRIVGSNWVTTKLFGFYSQSCEHIYFIR